MQFRPTRFLLGNLGEGSCCCFSKKWQANLDFCISGFCLDKNVGLRDRRRIIKGFWGQPGQNGGMLEVKNGS